MQYTFSILITRYILPSAIGVVLAMLIFGIFIPPILAPTLDSKILGLQTANEAGQTFTVPYTSGTIGADIAAKSFLVFEWPSGTVLAQRSLDRPVAIASLTKLMTGYLILSMDVLDKTIIVPSLTTVNVNPTLGLQAGDEVVVKDLFNAMIIGSANDAAKTLGWYIADTKKQPIADIMNQAAHDLHMENTHYQNAIGFDSETNYSTANDLQLLVEAIIRYPAFQNIDTRSSYSFTAKNGQSFSVKATNTLITVDPEIHAIKTGYTDEAQGAMIISVHHNAKKFVIIVLQSTNREEDALKLKEQIIQTYYQSQ